MKQKIWMVSWYGTQIGGLERIVQIIRRALEPHYDVKIIDIPYICSYNKIYKILYCNNRLAMMILFSFFTKTVAEKEDIIITHGQNAPFIRSDFLFDHGSIMSLKRKMGENIYSGSSIFEGIAARKAKMNIAVSEWTKKEIIKNYRIKENKIIVLNNCVESDMFYPIARKQNRNITILFCGRLEKAKGLDILIEIADLVENSHKFELKIAANTKYNTQLFRNRRNIHIECGIPIEKMNDFYNSGDVLMVPSKCEGFGMGIVESLSAGILVVANKVGIVEELLESKCPGLVLFDYDKGADGLLNNIQGMIDDYRDFDKRLYMHSFIEEHYGYKQYRTKLLTLIQGE